MEHAPDRSNRIKRLCAREGTEQTEPLRPQPIGMVHAYMDQKLLKSNKIKSFN